MKRKICGVLFVMTFVLTACNIKQEKDCSVSSDVSNNWTGTTNEKAEYGTEYGTENAIYNQEKHFLTMNELVKLCDNEKWEDEIAEKGIDFFSKYSNLEQVTDPNSDTWLYLCDIDYNNKVYELQIYYYPFNTSEKNGHVENEVDFILLQDTETFNSQMLYNCENQEFVNTDINSFLKKEFSIEQYLEFELPEGFSLGDFKLDMNNAYDGCLFIGNYKEKPHGTSVPAANYSAGGIGVCSEDGILIFNNQEIAEVTYFVNHSWKEAEGILLKNANFSAILYEYGFDIFTNEERLEYENEYGVNLTDEDVVTHYWYVFIGREGEKESYLAFFNKDCFTRKEVEQFVSTVRIK